MKSLAKIVRVERIGPGLADLWVHNVFVTEGDEHAIRDIARKIRRGLKPLVVPTGRRTLR